MPAVICPIAGKLASKEVCQAHCLSIGNVVMYCWSGQCQSRLRVCRACLTQVPVCPGKEIKPEWLAVVGNSNCLCSFHQEQGPETNRVAFAKSQALKAAREKGVDAEKAVRKKLADEILGRVARRRAQDKGAIVPEDEFLIPEAEIRVDPDNEPAASTSDTPERPKRVRRAKRLPAVTTPDAEPEGLKEEVQPLEPITPQAESTTPSPVSPEPTTPAASPVIAEHPPLFVAITPQPVPVKAKRKKATALRKRVAFDCDDFSELHPDVVMMMVECRFPVEVAGVIMREVSDQELQLDLARQVRESGLPASDAIEFVRVMAA